MGGGTSLGLALSVREGGSGGVGGGGEDLWRCPGIWPRLPARQLSAAVWTRVDRGECWGAGVCTKVDNGVLIKAFSKRWMRVGGPGGGGTADCAPCPC